MDPTTSTPISEVNDPVATPSISIIHGGHGPAVTPGFIFFHARPDPLSDFDQTTVGYYPFFKGLTTPTIGSPSQSVIFTSGPVAMTKEPWEGKQQSVVFSKAGTFSIAGKFSWIIFDDADFQLVDSIVGAAKLDHDDFTQTFIVKKDDGHLVYEADGWKYSSVYYCE